MKYIDKFANISSFLKSDLQKIEGDRIAVIDGFELPILKKKLRTVETIDASTGETIVSEELQDVWLSPIGQEEKVEHKYSMKISVQPNGNDLITKDIDYSYNIYAELGNFQGGDSSIDGTNVTINSTSTIKYSYYIFLFDNGIEIPKSRYEIKVRSDKDRPWKSMGGNVAGFTDPVSSMHVSFIPRITNTYYKGHEVEIQIENISNIGTYTFDLSDLVRFVIDGEDYFMPSFKTNVIISNQGESPLRNQLKFYDGIKPVYPAGVSVRYIGNYSYEVRLPNNQNLNFSLLNDGFGFHFEDDDFMRRALYMSSSGTSSDVVYNDENTTISMTLASWSNDKPSNICSINNLGTVFESTTDATYEFDVPIVYIISRGPIIDYGKQQFPTISNKANVSVANTLISKMTLHFKIVYGNGGLDELVLPEGTTTIDSMALQEYSNGEKERPTKFAIPEGVTTIKDNAFWGWRIEEISFPSTLELVEGRAFQLYPSEQGGTRLASVTLPANCKYFDNTFGGISQASFAVMESDPNTMQTTWYPVTVNGGQVYSKALSEILTTEQKQTLMNNSNLYSGIWNQLDPNYYDNIQKKVTIADFDNIYPQASDDPMNQPYLSIDGNYMFNGWQQLKEVRFPSYATGRIGDSMFDSCISLQSVTGIDNITEIGSGAFRNTPLQSFTLPASVSTIKQNAFRWESNDEAPLTSFIIPSNSMLTKIEGYAFAGQINLMEITLPDSCKYMANSFSMITLITGGVQAWDMHDPNHYGQIVEDGTTEITYGQFQNNSTDFQYSVSYYLPSSVTTIGGWAFNNTQNLANISLHEGITSIGDQSFANLYSLNTITLPSTLTYLGSGAFWNDNQLSVIFPASWNVTSIPENCFNGCSFSNSKNITLPSGITSIGDKAFKNCQIESVVMPSTVTSIGNGAFAGTHLTAVTLPNGCTWYETSFPAGCTVTSDTVPTPIVANLADKNASGVLGTDWFQMNYGYDYICTIAIIPEGVTGLQTYGSSWFSYNTKDFIKEVQLPTTIDGLQVGVGAFRDMSALETIDVSNFISINKSLFEGDSNLFKNTAPTFAAGLLTIGECAFKGTMKNVTTLDLSGLADLQTVGYNAFAGTGLTSVTLPAGVVYYPNSFPAGCTVTGGTLTTYDETNVKADAGIDIWTEGATSITSDPLAGPTGSGYKNKITNLTVPASIQVIGPSVFANMPNLIDVRFLHTHEPLEIQNSAFNYIGIRSLSIPAGCSSIGDDAFRGSADLTTISFVSSKGEHDLTTIGKNAFKDTGLTSVTFPAASNASYWPNSFPVGCTVTGGSMVDNTIHLSGGYVQSQYNWQSTYTKAVIDSDVTGFGYARVFEGHETLAEVVFNNEMEGLRIGENMFAQCPFLKTVTFNGGYVNIGNNAFAGTALTSVTLPAGSTYETDSFPAGCTVTVATAE